MFRKFLRKVKRRLTNKPYLKDPARVGYWFDAVIGPGPARLVQIGSNDGKTGDPLYPIFQKHPAWRGLLVEPIPYIFAKLKANYPAPDRFDLANVAIGENGKLPFYYVDKSAINDLPDLPYWYDQLGSFDRGHIVKELDGVLEPYIRSMEVESMDLGSLLDRYGIADIDVLHIDAEGYDWKVLQQLDLTRFKPTFILCEHHHLNLEERKAALAFLALDYEVFRVGIDWLAARRDLVPEYLAPLTKQFTRARAEK
jgi:FkbM family methyltransferase